MPPNLRPGPRPAVPAEHGAAATRSLPHPAPCRREYNASHDPSPISRAWVRCRVPGGGPVSCQPIGEKFRRDIRDWAQASGIPLIRFKAGERKADVMAPYLQAAAAAGRSQAVAVGCAQEFQLVWTARRRDTDPAGCPQFSFTREQRRVSVFYVYIFDTQMGPGFIKICTYFPYPVKAWVNGQYAETA